MSEEHYFDIKWNYEYKYRIPPNCSTGCLDQFLEGARIKNIQTANFSKYYVENRRNNVKT